MNVKLIPNERLQEQLYDMVGHRKVLHIICEENKTDIINRKNNIVSKNKIKRKPVYCANNNRTYQSIKEASIALGLDAGAISRCINGKQKSTNGMTFKLKETK